MFGLFGSLFVLTQFLQFELGYTPLEAGVRMLPAAGAIALVAPLSAPLVRMLGTKVTIATGMLCATAGLWHVSTATTSTAYTGIVLGMSLMGVGAGLVIPSATASVMGSLPAEHTGVGSATNGTLIQTGGALGVAVVGSLLSGRYDAHLTRALARYHLPPGVDHTIHDSLGAALGVAHDLGGSAGAAVAGAARAAFMSGAHLGLLAAAVVGLVGALIALATIPGRAAASRRPGHGARTAAAR
jgi:Na+/melibiose symporter-like transporter